MLSTKIKSVHAHQKCKTCQSPFLHNAFQNPINSKRTRKLLPVDWTWHLE
jgi:hypothetical protein